MNEYEYFYNQGTGLGIDQNITNLTSNIVDEYYLKNWKILNAMMNFSVFNLINFVSPVLISPGTVTGFPVPKGDLGGLSSGLGDLFDIPGGGGDKETTKIVHDKDDSLEVEGTSVFEWIHVLNDAVIDKNLYTSNADCLNLYSSNMYGYNAHIQTIKATDISTVNIYSSNAFINNLEVANEICGNLEVINIISDSIISDTVTTSNLSSISINSSNIISINAFINNLDVGNELCANLQSINIISDNIITQDLNSLNAQIDTLSFNNINQINYLNNQLFNTIKKSSYTNEISATIRWEHLPLTRGTEITMNVYHGVSTERLSGNKKETIQIDPYNEVILFISHSECTGNPECYISLSIEYSFIDDYSMTLKTISSLSAASIESRSLFIELILIPEGYGKLTLT